MRPSASAAFSCLTREPLRRFLRETSGLHWYSERNIKAEAVAQPISGPVEALCLTECAPELSG